MTMNNSPTKQGKVKSEVGYKKPPKHTQFGQPNGNPRHNGAWKKEDTPRYKLEQMMKLTEAELADLAQNKESPYFERKIAVCIAKGDWKEIESMINQVYGQPKQQIDHTIAEPKPLVDLTKRAKNGKNNSSKQD